MSTSARIHYVGNLLSFHKRRRAKSLGTFTAHDSFTWDIYVRLNYGPRWR